MKLKRCPFCGGKGKLISVDQEDDPNDGGKFIECQSCSASTAIMFPLMDGVDALLAEKWNLRVAAQQGTPDAN